MNLIKSTIHDLGGFLKEAILFRVSQLKELKTTLWGMIYNDVIDFAAEETHQLTCRPEMPNYKEFPTDLQDRQGDMTVTPDGYAVSGRLTQTDVMFGSLSPVQYPLMGIFLSTFMFIGITVPAYLVMPLWPNAPFSFLWAVVWFVVFIITLKFSGLPDTISKLGAAVLYIISTGLFFVNPYGYQVLHLTWWTPSIAFIPPIIAAFVPLFFEWVFRRVRRQGLLQAADDGAVLVSGFNLKRTKQLQLEKAKKDQTPFIRFGTSTGRIRYNGDNLAADPNMPMGLTAKDTSTHMIILGVTGSGKTFNGFRPYVRQWISARCGGAVIMDGKGELPADLAKDIPEINVISPETSSFSIVAGLTPEQITLSIMETMKNDAANVDPLWDGLAEALLRHSAILLEGAVQRNSEIKWTLENIHRIINDAPFKGACVNAIKESLPKNGKLPELHLSDAIKYFNSEYKAMPEKQRGSVVTHVNRWLSPFMSNRDLRKWAAEDTGTDITQALQGEVFGLCLPEYKYGLAGIAITNLAKLRLYHAAQERGSNWAEDEEQTPCLIIIDECQEVMTDIDERFPAIARSFGVSLCVGCQTIDQLVERFKGKSEDKAYGMFEQFRSFMCFKSSKTTYQYLAERIGESRLLTHYFKQTALDYDAALKEIASSPIFDPNHPEKRIIRKGRRITVIGQLKEASSHILDQVKQKERPVRNLEYRLIVEPHDLGDVLSGPYTCLCSFNRAGVDRRDFITCVYQAEA